MAKLTNLTPKKITIYPYGGLLELDIKINTPIKKELLVALGGITSQTIYYIIIVILYNQNYLRDYILNLYKSYYYSILFFNLLPIHPLDGSKILRLILDYFLSYKLVNYLNIIISIITTIIVLISGIYQVNYSLIMIITIIINNLLKYYKDLNYYFHRFLLERYLYPTKYHKTKTITNINHMSKDKTHIFKEKTTYLTEKQVLNQKFRNIK